MNIILLSGGSGKRLWPLSNETRSKQFLKVLRSPEGACESMIQRVWRQIHETIPNAKMIISTTDSQQEAIKRQLGGDVDIALEPERRDTFPAIALAAVFLAMERNCSMDETVIVMPVDAYAEKGYFQTLLKMDEAVQDNTADIILMGIRPTYPSTKYGYIVPKPKQISNLMKVESFSEKPSEKRAIQLLDMGAFWNGGVFAFKLGYIMEVVHHYIDPQGYAHLRENYCKLRKISFDYEVVEHCHSIAMVPYYGIWRDLGTWNTLTDVMQEYNAGMVQSGENISNTHIINELDIPVVALGLKNVVIAASPDGILVSDKQASTQLKTYVEQIDQRPMYEERQWGNYKVLDYMHYPDGKCSLTKHLIVKKGKNLSYQVHKNRDEIWTIVDGIGDLLIDGHIRIVRRGDVAYITRGMLHSIRAVTDLHLIEVQIGNELSENDIQRFDWDW